MTNPYLSFEGFGYREIGMAGELLTAYSDNPIIEMPISLGFIPNSGNVYITNYNDGECAMMNGKKIELFVFCNDCGDEGFESEMEMRNGSCEKCFSTIG